MQTQTQLIVNNIEIQSPKCGWWSCDNTADYKTLSGTIDGKKSESWGKLDYGYSKHLYHWNLCGKCFKEESGEDEDDESSEDEDEESDEDEEEEEERYCELEEGCPYNSYVWGETKNELEGEEYICDKCKRKDDRDKEEEE